MSDWKTMPEEKLAASVEESLTRETRWAAFEPNGEPLWAQLRSTVGAFMQRLFLEGAFAGATPAQAYFVRCDRTTMTQQDLDQGILNIVVGFAPREPAEFVVIQIQQLVGQSNP